MEQDRPNEYEEMMKSDEDFEEEVLEEDTDPIEKNIEDDINKVGKIKSEEDVREESVEIKETTNTLEEEPIYEDKEETHINKGIEEEHDEEIIIEEEAPLEEEITIQEKEEEEVVEKKEEPVVVEKEETPKKPIKRKVVAKRLKAQNKKPITRKMAIKASSKRKTIRKKKIPLAPIALTIIGILIIVFAVNTLTKTFPQESLKTAAVVNGETISINDLEKEYEFFFLIGGLPAEYKQQITKEFFLNSTIIPERLILQEATKNNIEVSEEQVDAFIQNSIAQSGGTIETFESTVNNLGLTLEDIKKYFKKQLISFKLLNQTILSGIEITDAEIESAYNGNKDLFEAQNQSLDDVREEFKQALLVQKQRTSAQTYMAQLVQKAIIEIYYTGTTTNTPQVIEELDVEEEEELYMEEELPKVTTDITTFSETNDELCEENGKPIIRLYSTSWCPHCNWVKETFDNVAKEYINLGKITAYHWQLDTGDNELTITTETSIPKSDVELFQKYNPEGYVPVFVFGCKYYRVGNGYETEDNLAAEEAEFRAVIHSLIQ